LKRADDSSLVLEISELTGVVCPNLMCNQVITDVQKYADHQTFEKFNQFAFDHVVASMRYDLPLCANCGYILQEDCLCVNADCRRLQMLERKREERIRLRLEREQKELDRALRDGVKCCPACFVEIEKDGGCDHMYCTRCQTHFNWSGAPQFGRNRGWYRLQKRKLFNEKA